MEEKKYSDIQILEDAIATIGRQQFPVEMAEVAMDLNRVRRNLIALHEAVAKAQAENGGGNAENAAPAGGWDEAEKEEAPAKSGWDEEEEEVMKIG